MFSILAPGGRVSRPRMKNGSMQKSGCLAFQWALWAAKCCHGSNKWDDNSKNRPKCCHGSNEWDDNSGAPITTCFTTYGSHCLQKLFRYAADGGATGLIGFFTIVGRSADIGTTSTDMVRVLL